MSGCVAGGAAHVLQADDDGADLVEEVVSVGGQGKVPSGWAGRDGKRKSRRTLRKRSLPSSRQASHCMPLL